MHPRSLRPEPPSATLRETFLNPGRLTARQVEPPPLSPQERELLDTVTGPIRSALPFVSRTPRVDSCSWQQPTPQAPGGLHIDWYEGDYSITLAVFHDPLQVPPARRHGSVTVFTHLLCADGEVTCRRSGAVSTARGLYQPAVAEGAEASELVGVVDIRAVAARSLAEELGIDLAHHADASVVLAAVTFSRVPATVSPTVRLHLLTSVPKLRFSEVLERWESAPDRWENDSVELRRPGGNGPEVPGLWWPAPASPAA